MPHSAGRSRARSAPASPKAEIGSGRSGPLDVFHGFGRDDDRLTLADEGRHHDPHAVVEHRRLEAVGRGLALHRGFGLGDLADHLVGKLDAERLRFIVLDLDHHAVLQERPPLAEDIGRDLDLLERVGIHEHQHPFLLVEELLVLLVEPHPLHLVGRAEPLVELAPVAHVLHLDLGEGAALARLHMGGLDHHPEPAVVLQDVPRPDFIAVDLRHVSINPFTSLKVVLPIVASSDAGKLPASDPLEP